MPTHPGHPAIASTTLVSASRSLLNDAFDSVSLQTVTATATLNPDDGRYVLVAPASHATITLPDPASDERYQNVRLVLKRTTAGVYTATVVVAGGGLIDGSSSTTLNAQYDCEVLFSDGTAWHRLRDQTNLLAPDYLDFGDWIVGTDDSNPAPVATSDAYTAPDGTTTADELEWDNTTELADESWAEPGASVLEAGDGAEYSFYIDSEVGDGIKTVLEVEDTSVPGLLEQTTVAFSNVFAEERYASYAPGSDPAGHYLSVGNWARVGDWTVASSAYSPPVDISSPFDFESITASGGGKRIVGDIGTESYIPGQEVTVSLWIYKPSFSTNAGNITWWFSLRDASNADVERILVYINTSGEIASISGVTSGGPGYTASNATRLQAHASDSDWAKLSIRLRDYSGTAIRTQIMFGYNATLGQKFTIAQPSFYLGDHVSSQQLLTVDDGVENLAIEAGYGEFSDLTLSAGASIATSSIAAPDGTLTAVDVTSASAITLSQDILDTDFGAAWNDAATWTASWYVYTPSLSTSSDFVVALLNGATVQESATVTIDSDGDITSFTGVTQGAPSLSAERTIYAQSIGNTGWIKYEITLHDNGAASDRVRFIPISASSASNTYTLWNPALRYGDWVARGKVGFSLPPIEWVPVSSAGSPQYSNELFLDGKSAVDWPLDVAGSGMWSDDPVMPTKGRITWSIYMRSTDASTYTNSSNRIRLNVRTRATITRIDRAFGIELLEGSVAKMDGALLAGEELTFERVGQTRWYHLVFSRTFDPTHGDMQDTAMYFYRDGSPPETTLTVSHPRVTVGNPADARGYFVSGPQSLLGDGSDYSSWSTGTAPQDVTVTTNQLVAPNGRLEADDITHTQGDNTYHYDTAASVLSGGETVHYVWYYKVDGALAAGAGETVQFSIKNSGGTVIEQINWAVAYDDATPTVALGSTTTAGSGYTTDALEYVAVSNDWVRCQITLTDFGSTGQDVEVYHYGLDGATSAGATYDVSLWGSEVTTLDRTPTANELRPVSNGVVDFDAYPPEHRSLFADLEDAGDNWYKVTTKITDI